MALRIGTWSCGGRLLLSAILLTAGCNWPSGYLPSVVSGELTFLSERIPIEDGLELPLLTEEERDKLAFVIRARDYAENTVGLVVANNYRQFVYLGDDYLAWNLSASRQDRFEPYIWYLPVAGPLPYLGFFDLDDALAERDRLVDDGYDTFVYVVDSYAIPLLPDPVTSQLLKRGYGDLAETVMHELTHNTIDPLTNVTYGESLAVFVGQTAGMEFLAAEFGEDSSLLTDTREQYEDREVFNTFLQDLVAELNDLYASDITSETKIEQRDAVFETARLRFADEVLPRMNRPDLYEAYSELHLNNAFLLANVRYHTDLDVFAAIYEMVDRDWSSALALFNTAARKRDPNQFLKDQLDK